MSRLVAHLGYQLLEDRQRVLVRTLVADFADTFFQPVDKAPERCRLSYADFPNEQADAAVLDKAR